MRKLWNDGWKFVKLPTGSTYEDMKAAGTADVNLPHDWLISQENDLYESGDGWYVKTLGGRPKAGEHILLDFDGVYTDADVLLNGEVIRTHRYGYSPFFVELTDGLKAGDNEIAVHIRHLSPNTRWYSGAGIFRDVGLITLPERYMVPDGFHADTVIKDGVWTLCIGAELAGPGDGLPEYALTDEKGALAAEGKLSPAPGGAAAEIAVENAETWSPDSPALYKLELRLGQQSESMNVGFRHAEFTTDRGMLLNGRHVKLHGVCLHHDLGALGAAFNEKAAERQLKVMKEMGVNAVRTSHNPPARQLLDLCDRMGFVVMDEIYDMWEKPKTANDNARFFADNYPEDIAAWIRRDRCHPSVILWSIGNEIYDMQASERGEMWTRTLMEEVRKHDSVHAPVTFASNYMPWGGAQKCADIVKMPGYNYAERYYAQHHEKHPDWVIYGSETASLVASRGIYHFPMSESILTEEDLQCSALMNSCVNWGAQDLRKMLVEDMLTEYSLGQFIWSGIDYIGEPTPYHTRSSYFGQTDTACFPKDAYYFYKAVWTDEPMIHIGVIWDWNEGELIDVPVMTNGAEAELFLNGSSLGRKKVDLRDIEGSLPVWRVPYRAGVLEARAYDARGAVIAETKRESFSESKKIALSAERTVLESGCGDIAFITVTVLDEAGREVENAVDRVHVELSGPGVLLGLDNGDSADRDGYKVNSRRLFSGRLLIMVGAGDACGEIRLRVSGRGLESAELALSVVTAHEGAEKRAFNDLCRSEEPEEDVFIRRIDLRPLSDTTVLTPERPEISYEIRILPENATDREVKLRVTNRQGVEVPCAVLKREGNVVTVTGRGDGEMYLRASANNGYGHPRVISVTEISSSGFGPVSPDPYGFVSASLCTVKEGDITGGNEHGIAFARDGVSAVGFDSLDFGSAGTDELTLTLFATGSDVHEIKLWDGLPSQGGRVIDVLPYQKPVVWNLYQPQSFKLSETLRGVHTIAFSADKEAHLKGFSFAKQSRASRRISAAEADAVYGDSYKIKDGAVLGIGNNVTLSFGGLYFEGGSVRLILDGATGLDVNTVTVRVAGPDGEEEPAVCGFRRSERGEQTFSLKVPRGMCTLSFVFLPGSSFDFYGFRFEKE